LHKSMLKANPVWSRPGCIGAQIVIWRGQRWWFLARRVTLQPPDAANAHRLGNFGHHYSSPTGYNFLSLLRVNCTQGIRDGETPIDDCGCPGISLLQPVKILLNDSVIVKQPPQPWRGCIPKVIECVPNK
jgi:hypothetical protein